MRAPLEPQLDRASAILFVGDNVPAIEAAARARGLPVFHGSLEPDPDAVASVRSKKVLAFAGIGDPEKFFATLAAPPGSMRRSGAASLITIATAPARQGRSPATPSKENLQLLTTEKDFARLKDDAMLAQLAERARALPVTMKIREADAFGRLVLGAIKRT